MPARLPRCATLLCLLALPVLARAAEPAAPPALVVRVQSIDGLLDNVRYLANLAGRGEEAKQFEGMIRARAGAGGGLEGIDTKRPLGLYGSLGEGGVDGTAVALIPVTDEKAVLGLLEQLNLKAEKGEDGVYTLTPEQSPVPIYFRFANGYAHVTARDKAAIDKDNLLAPAKVLAGDQNSVASALIRIDQIPDGLKQIALTTLQLQLAEAKEKKEPNETEAQHKLKEEIVEAVFNRMTSVIKEGGEVKVELNVDRKAGKLAGRLSLAGMPDTALAKDIARLAQSQSLLAGLQTPDAALNAVVHASLPASLRDALNKALDEGIRSELAKQEDAAKRRQAEKVARALQKAIDVGQLDAGVSLRPSGDKYTLVAGVKLKDGKAADAALRDVLQAVPEEERGKIKLDVEKVGDAVIHRVEAEKQLDPQAQQLLGRHPLYLAFRPDALLLAAGPEGLAAIKDALGLEPKAAPPLRVELSLGRLAAAMARDQEAAPEAARKAFGKKDGGDRVVLTLEGGKALQARVEMGAPVIRFLHLLEQAEKGEQ